MNLQILRTPEELARAKEKLVNAPEITYDTETTGLNWWKTRVFLHSFCTGDETFLLFNKHHDEDTIRNFIRAPFSDREKTVIGQNLKFDKHQLKHTHGIDIDCKVHDTQIQSFLLDENSPCGLKPRLRQVLGFETDDDTAVKVWLTEHFAKREDWDFSQVPDEIIAPYAGMDTWGCMKLHKIQYPMVQDQFGSLYDTEIEVNDILYRMEQYGMPVDVNYIRTTIAEWKQKLVDIQNRIFLEFGVLPATIDSPIELAEYLYGTGKGQLALPVPHKTKKGQNSVDGDALKQLQHPISSSLHEYAELRYDTSFFEGTLERCDENGILHPDYSQTRTKTGRFACSNPNMQNVKKKAEIRRAFIAESGDEMWLWDQSQIEMVGVALYSKDPKMLAALRSTDKILGDLHRMTASEVLEIPPELIDKQQRGMGKGTNFAIVYCVGQKKLGMYLTDYAGRKVETEEALEFKRRYISKFPNVHEFQQSVIGTANTYREPYGNFVKNKFGRVRRCANTKLAYQLVNHLVQGWAADLIKASMVKVDKALNKPKWRQQVHDAIRIDFPGGHGKDFSREVSHCLTDWPEIQVDGKVIPVRCTVEMSTTNWAEVQDVE